MTIRKPTDRLTLAANLIVVALALWLLARPGGPVAGRLTEWREDRRIQAEIRASWTELSRGPRADSNRAATRVVVAFSDYQCPACQIAHARFAELARTERIGVI